MKKYSLLTISGIIVLVFLVTLLIRLIPAIHSLELKTIDWRFQWRGPVSVKHSSIVLVTIDDQSFESLPDRWPWPRSYYAHVIRNLTQAGAKTIGLDVTLDIPDKYGEQSDSLLAEVIYETGNVVLTGKLEERISLGQIRSYQFPVKPIPLLLEADGTWGVTAIQADADGLHRKYFLLQEYSEGSQPSFGLQVLRKYLKVPENINPEIGEDRVKFGQLSIPVNEDGLMIINFAGPAGTYPRYSFDSVIDDTSFNLGDYDLDYFSESLLPDNVFKDKIVLIGSTVSELHDNFPTPFFEFSDREGRYQRAEMPGVEIHANAIWTILNQLYFQEVPAVFSLIFILAIIVLVYFIVTKLPTSWSIIVIIVLILTFVVSQFILFANSRLIMEMVAPVMAIFLSFVATNLHQYIITQREKKLIIGTFERYVPDKVVKELLAHPEKLTLGGEERFISVMFADLENFTSVSEKLNPDELVKLMNYYLTEMTDVILKYDGIIDKYEGDAIMAEFGVPVHFEDHAVKACLAALDMQESIKKLNLSRFNHVINRLNCRIGINSGDMIVGNMGSRNVFDYTAMGDAVNLAARLETANKAYHTHVMISEDTYDLVKDHVIIRLLDRIQVKGREKPVKIYEVFARKTAAVPENIKSMFKIFETGLSYYYNQDWEKAKECFRYCLNIVDADGPSRLFLNRIAEFSETPPPDDWDGVYKMTTK